MNMIDPVDAMDAIATAPRAGSLPAQFGSAARQALQWRLLALWLAALALPLLLASLPLWIALDAALGHALLGAQLTESFDPTVLIELLTGLGQRGYTPAAGLPALLVLCLLLPWLGGLVIVAARSRRPLGFGALLHGGLREYGRMARLWLWALVPLGLAAAAMAGLLHLAKEQALELTLEADAARLGRGALALGTLLLLLAHASLDAARAQLALEPQCRSVLRAWWRASKDMARHPGRIVLYLLVTAAGLLLAALLGWARIQLPAVNGLSFALALLLGQALVLALAWMRCARLFALVAAAR